MKLIVLISLIGLVIDVISKQIVVHNMIEYQSIPIIDSFFSITYAKNTGIAFSMLDGNVGFIVVMTIFILFLVYITSLIKYATRNKVEDVDPCPKGNFILLKNILMVVIGGACVHFCGNIVVDNAGEIAKTLGINPTVISFSLLSLGAGLPELITSIVALRKNQNEIILGNVIGSNIVNSSFALGLCSFFNPISVDKKMFSNLMILLLSAIFVFAILKRQGKIKRYQGFILLTIYFSYTLYLFF